MIARIAVFEGQPDRFTSDHGYRYVIDVLREAQGCKGAFHVAGTTDSISVSLWDDEESMEIGERAIAAERERLNLRGSPPSQVGTYRVVNSTDRPLATP